MHHSQTIYDTIIVGAGPCGLAVAARLREKHPSALFTDEEQARYSWVARNARRTSIKNKKHGRVQDAKVSPAEPSILVLDSSGTEWMANWNRLFRALDISHLRSPMFFHPDPSDRDALLAYAYSHGFDAHMQEIRGCVGKEVSKHKQKRRTACRRREAMPAVEVNERDRVDYFAPSTSCFDAFCEACKARYNLKDRMIRHETVLDVDYDFVPHISDAEKLFRLQTDRSTHIARTVVLATGGGVPSIPLPFSLPLPEEVSHAMRLQNDRVLSRNVLQRIKAGRHTNVLIIGGGLTSAQLADAIIRRGVSKVWLLMRGPWKVKPFDIDLSWMSKFKNHQKATFWSSDSFEERLSLVQEARNGGSMTPRFAKILHQHVQKGRLSVHQHTIIKSQDFSKLTNTWTITTQPDIADLPELHHVYFATGSAIDVKSISFLQSMHQKYPVEAVGGYPIVNDSLMWDDDVPLFVTGKLAALQLGPGAANLEGARLGAERIAWAVEERMQQASDEIENGFDVEESMAGVNKDRYMHGIGSKFGALAFYDEP